MRKLLLFCTSTSLLLALSACSGGVSSGTGTSTGIVSAQTTYSNSSLSGTYSITLTNTWNQKNGVVSGGNNGYSYSGVGTIQLNGSGAITGGTLDLYINGAPLTSPNAPVPCPFSVTGTYNVQSTALGTAVFNFKSSTAGCTTSETFQLALAAADGGNAIQFIETDGDIMSVLAIKQ